jgi:Xaa-Pro aminopeptidase
LPDDERGFDAAEFQGRLARLRDAMGRAGVNAFLVDDLEILAWVTGYETSLSLYRACIVPLNAPPLMVLRKLDVAPFLENAWFADHRAFADWDDPFGAVAAGLRERGLGSARIGFDPASHALTVDGHRRLTATLPEASFVEMPGAPWELRLIKSPAEVARIARASAIADETMRDIASRARPGMTERDAAVIAARRYVELGGDPGHTGPITAGRGWDHLHGHLHDRPLDMGEILHLELVPRFGGYSARLMRCIAIGGSTPAQRAMADALIRLQDAQIAALRPGVEARDADAVLRDGILREGLRNTFDNITGYTLGYYSKQPVRSSDFTRILHPRVDWRFEAGMVLHIYASAQGQAISETVHVTPNGAERLTRLERRLFEGVAP